MIRAFLVSALLMTGATACRDVGVVGDGSACAEGCDANERCMGGACVPRNDGVAGQQEHDEEEHDEEEHDEEEHDEEEHDEEEHEQEPSESEEE